jgi:hypothetical protein
MVLAFVSLSLIVSLGLVLMARLFPFDLRFWESDFVLGFHRFSMYLSAKYSVLI